MVFLLLLSSNDLRLKVLLVVHFVVIVDPHCLKILFQIRNLPFFFNLQSFILEFVSSWLVGWLMVFNATFNNISIILWWS
jgi:hypothetical protein